MVQAYDYYGTATSKGETEPPLQGRLIGISSIQLCCGSTDQVAPAVVDRHDETGGTHLVTNEDLYSAASGYFFMATDSRGGRDASQSTPRSTGIDNSSISSRITTSARSRVSMIL